MPGKQHTSFRYMLLGIVFLLFNCVCTAASVIKITSEDYKQAVSLQLTQNAGANETEEDSSLIASSYVNRFARFSVRKQYPGQFYNTCSNNQIAFADIGWQLSYLPAKHTLPTPGYYAFLFRYTLF